MEEPCTPAINPDSLEAHYRISRIAWDSVERCEADGFVGEEALRLLPHYVLALERITEFCHEHPEWFGDSGIEQGWLDYATVLVNKAKKEGA